MTTTTSTLPPLGAVAAALALLSGCASAAAGQATQSRDGCVAAPGLRLCDAWVRLTPTGDTAAAYATITSTGPADILTAARTDLSGVATLHETVHNGPVEAMRAVDRLAVPAGGTLRPAVDSDHVMVEGPTRTALVGATVRLTLIFSHAGTLTVEATGRGYPTAPTSAGVR